LVAQADEERGRVTNDEQMREAITAEFFRRMKQVTGRNFVSLKIDRACRDRR
jgi:hypothetical protein